MKSASTTAFFTCTVLATGSAAIDISQMPWEFEESPARTEELTSYEMPFGPFRGGEIQSFTVEGSLRQTVVRVAGSRPTLELLSAFRDLLNRTSHRVLYQCEARRCGGFDFRLNIDVAPAPDMFVDLGDFRFLSAVKVDSAGTDYVTLLVSRTELSGFVQITEIATKDVQPTPAWPLADQTNEIAGLADTPDSLIETLQENGFAVLETLEFESGSTSLGNATSPELLNIARYLYENPGVSVVLVGHTDAKGSLESNVELSAKRAESVRTHLIDVEGVDPAQLQAEGVGFLAPRATNTTAEGREKNRRVEIVLIIGN